MNDFKVSCELTAKSGKIAKLGDSLIVYLPEVDRTGDYGGSGFWSSAKTIRAELKLQLSRGLVLRVIEIIETDEDDDSTLKTGSIIPFRRTSWEWNVDIKEPNQ